MRRSRHLPTLTALLALMPGPRAAADTDLAGLVADPDLPLVRFAYRGSLRGTLAVRLPVLRPERFHGFGLDLTPFAEFHGDDGDDEILPNDNWRGRARAEASWRRGYDDALLAELWLGLSLEHESDHRTSPAPADPQARQLNFWSPQAGALLRLPRGELWIEASPRVYFITCTRSDSANCFGEPGNDSFGATLDVVYDVGRREAADDAFHFFVAVHGGVVAANDTVEPERRLVLHTGTRARRRSGLWQIHGIVWLGNDVGYFRDRTYYQAGAAFAYSP